MKTFVKLLALVCVLGLTACNTVEGAGKDIKAGGEKIEDTAAEHK